MTDIRDKAIETLAEALGKFVTHSDWVNMDGPNADYWRREAAVGYDALMAAGVIVSTDSEPSDAELWRIYYDAATGIYEADAGRRAVYNSGRSVALAEAKAEALEEAANEIRAQMGRDEVALCGFDGEWQLATSSRNMLNGATRFAESLRARAAAIRAEANRG